jgi:curved DNA-binding protein CbpA
LIELKEIEAAYRTLAKLAHSDHGGDVETMKMLIWADKTGPGGKK